MKRIYVFLMTLKRLVRKELLFLVVLLFAGVSEATTNCTFTTVGTTMTLDGDCSTDETLLIPNGYTLDGAGYTITAGDPSGGHFVGAVVMNAGTTAHVTNLGVTASALANVCDAGTSRLRGILFDGASGSITNNTVDNINQGLSGCQEGNGIEVRNAPFNGTYPNTKTVVITGNVVTKYQKTGIVANGDVDVAINNNYVGSAELPEYIAANSIQVGFGGMGSVNNNEIVGNQWDVISTPQWSAMAVLVYFAGTVNVNHNEISGDGTDIGVGALYSATVNVMNNVIGRTPPAVGDTIDADGVGVWFYDNSGKSKVVRNTFSGWNTAFEGADLAKVNAIEP
jgi:hypothetical protein